MPYKVDSNIGICMNPLWTFSWPQTANGAVFFTFQTPAAQYILVSLNLYKLETDRYCDRNVLCQIDTPVLSGGFSRTQDMEWAQVLMDYDEIIT